MSYAEYGSRIFFTQKIATKFSIGQGDELPDKHSGCRLKMQDSCLDIRAWSLNQSDYFQYFRELTELESSTEKINHENLIVDIPKFAIEKELEYVRRELAKYKSLKLTPEQKKQLGQSDLWEVFSKEGWNIFESIIQRVAKFKGYKKALLERAFPNSVPEIEEIHQGKVKSKQSNNDNGLWTNRQKLITENNTEKNYSTTTQLSSSSSKLDTDKDDVCYTNNEHNDMDNINSVRNYPIQTSPTKAEREYLIEAKSRINKLESTINAKDAEIEEYKNLNMQLESVLENRNVQIDDLHDKFARLQNQLRELSDQHNFEVNELKLKLSDGKNLIDQLKKKLEEQRLQCNSQMKKIEILKCEAIDAESLRKLLAKKLNKVLKNVNGIEVHESIEMWIHERKALKAENENLEMQCLEQETEINRLSKLIDCIQSKNENKWLKVEKTIKDLEKEIEEKNLEIENYANQLSLLKESKEKFIDGKLLHQDEMSDKDLDRTLGKYLQTKVGKIEELSGRLEDAWNCVKRRNIKIDDLQRQIAENESLFQDEIKEKCKEVEYYCKENEEYKKIIENQTIEIEQLQKNLYKIDKESVDNLEKEIQKIQSKLNALQKENSCLLNENENLNCKINETNVEITTLENENERSAHKIKIMNMQLEEKDLKLEALKEESSQMARTLKDTNNKLENILVKSHLKKFEDEKINSLSQLQKEIVKDDKEKRKLEETITQLRIEFDDYKKKNKHLEDNLLNISNQKKLLETNISVIKEDIIKLLNDYNDNNNTYSDKNLIQIPKKLFEKIITLNQSLDLSDINIYSGSELIANNYAGEYNENGLEKLKQNKTIYDDHNKNLKRLKNESTIISPFHLSLKVNNDYNDNKNCNNNNLNGHDFTLTYFEHMSSSLDKNIEDFSQVNEQYKNNSIDNCHIFFPHNGTHGQVQSKQSQSHQETVRPEDLARKEFIRNCSERRNSENY